MATEKAFRLDIVTPSRVLYSGQVTSFTAPGTVGSFQVLYNHAPLVAEIGIGEVKFQPVGGEEVHLATSGGYVEVADNTVTVLAETAERSGEIDLQRAQAARERAQLTLSQVLTGSVADEARIALARARNRLRLAGKG